MLLIIEFGISLVLFALCVALVWAARPLKTWPIALAFGVGLVLIILGIVFSAALYPWTALLVLLVAGSAGLWLGRVISIKHLWPFLLLLVMLSVLDTTQIVLSHLSSAPSGGTQSANVPAGDLYINFLLFLPNGRHYVIGIFDLWLVTAMAEYWRRRGAEFWLALVPGVFALVLVYGLILLFPGLSPLALIPFLTAGWLGSIALYRARSPGSMAKVLEEDG